MNNSKSVTTKFFIKDYALLIKSLNPKGLGNFSIGKACVKAIDSMESRISKRDNISKGLVQLNANTNEASIRKNIKKGFLTQQNVHSILCLLFHDFEIGHKFYQPYTEKSISSFLNSISLSHNKPGSVLDFRDFFARLDIPDNYDSGYEITIDENWNFNLSEQNNDEHSNLENIFKSKSQEVIKAGQKDISENVTQENIPPKRTKINYNNIVIVDIILIIIFIFSNIFFITMNRPHYSFETDPLKNGKGFSYLVKDSKYFDTLGLHIEKPMSIQQVELKIILDSKKDREIMDYTIKIKYPKKGTDSITKITSFINSNLGEVTIEDIATLSNLPDSWSMNIKSAYIYIPKRKDCDSSYFVNEKLDLNNLTKNGIHLKEYIPKIENSKSSGDCSSGYISIFFIVNNREKINRKKIVGTFDLDPLKKGLGFSYFEADRNHFDTLIANINSPKNAQIFSVLTHINNTGNTDIPDVYLGLDYKQNGTESSTKIKGVIHSSKLGEFKDAVTITNLPKNWELKLISYSYRKFHYCDGFLGGNENSFIDNPISIKNLKNSSYKLGTLPERGNYVYNGKDYIYESCIESYLLANFSLTNRDTINSNY